MDNVIDKVKETAALFVQFEDGIGCPVYFNTTIYGNFEGCLHSLMISNAIEVYSIVNTKDAENSGVISIAFIDKDGSLRHENFPWYVEI